MISRHFVFKSTSIAVLSMFLFSNTVSFSGVGSAPDFDFSKETPSLVRALSGKNAPAIAETLRNESEELMAARSELRYSDEAFRARVEEIDAWQKSSRFSGIRRLFSPAQVAEQRGSGSVSDISRYQVARDAAIGFYDYMRNQFSKGKAIMTFGPFSPKQAVAMKQKGIRGIYLGGWATSAKGSADEDPGPDLASYPLSQVPNEASGIVRALLTEDQNQAFKLRRMSASARAQFNEVDYSPWIIADADTGHGGDPHVRNLARRFVEVGVPGYHIEDQKPGCKKCGHQDGKVLVSIQEHIMRLNAMRFQLDVMGVPGIIVARTDSEAADFLDNNTDHRDHGFILGATNTNLPSYKLASLAVLKRFYEKGMKDINGHLMYQITESDYKKSEAWLESSGIMQEIDAIIAKLDLNDIASLASEKALKEASSKMHAAWKKSAKMKTFGDAVAEVMSATPHDFEMSVDEWLKYSKSVSHEDAREKARDLLEYDIEWDWELPRTPEGYYQVQAGIEYAIHRSLQFAPYADLLWMETKTANLEEARHFAEGIHAVYPDKMLAYNLSPSFNWDTTGMSEDEMRNFGIEMGKLGFVFNFITYAGHQNDFLSTEEFADAYVKDGPLALARVQRRLRLMKSPAVTPQGHVGGPRVDKALQASWGQTATTEAMGAKSTEHKQGGIELSPAVLESWLKIWAEINGYPTQPLKVELGPTVPGQEELSLNVFDGEGNKLAFVTFRVDEDRSGVKSITVKNQDTFEQWRNRRLTTLLHLFAALRFKADKIHYLSPTDANQNLARRLQELGILSDVASDGAGHILAANFNKPTIQSIVATTDSIHAFLKKSETVPAAKSELRSNHVPKPDLAAEELAKLQRELSSLLAIGSANRTTEQNDRIAAIEAMLPATTEVVMRHNGAAQQIPPQEGTRSELRKLTADALQTLREIAAPNGISPVQAKQVAKLSAENADAIVELFATRGFITHEGYATAKLFSQRAILKVGDAAGWRKLIGDETKFDWFQNDIKSLLYQQVEAIDQALARFEARNANGSVGGVKLDDSKKSEIVDSSDRVLHMLPYGNGLSVADIIDRIQSSNLINSYRIARNLPLTITFGADVFPTYPGKKPKLIAVTVADDFTAVNAVASDTRDIEDVLGKGGVRWYQLSDADYGRKLSGNSSNPILAEAVRLAEAMNDKNPFAGIFFDGGKTDIAARANANKESVLRRWVASSISANVLLKNYIAGPDMNMGEPEMAIIVDEADRVQKELGLKPRILATTSRNVSIGSYPHELWTVTSISVVTTLFAALSNADFARSIGLNPNQITVAIQGYGDVGSGVIQYLNELNTARPELNVWGRIKIVGVSAKKGGIYNPDGLVIARLLEARSVMQSFAIRDDFDLRTAYQGSHADYVDPIDVLFKGADVIIPAAGPNVFTSAEQVERLKKAGTKLLVEGANNSVKLGTEKAFAQEGIAFFPGPVANFGGIFTSTQEFLDVTSKGEAGVIKNIDERRIRIQDLIRSIAAENANWLIEQHLETGASIYDLHQGASAAIRARKVELLGAEIETTPMPFKRRYGTEIDRELPDNIARMVAATETAREEVLGGNVRSELRRANFAQSRERAAAVDSFGSTVAKALNLISGNRSELRPQVSLITPKSSLKQGKIGFSVARSIAFDDALLLVIAELARTSSSPVVVVAPTRIEQELVAKINASLPEESQIESASSPEAAANILWAKGAVVTTYLTREELDAALLSRVYSEVVVLTQNSISKMKSGIAGLAEALGEAVVAYSRIVQAA